MIKLFFIFIQLAILVVIGSLIIDYSFPVSVTFDEIILFTSTSFLIFSVILIIFFIILAQRLVFFFKYRCVRCFVVSKTRASSISEVCMNAIYVSK
mgnify:CR=1 FL=1